MANNHLLPTTFNKIINREQTTAPMDFRAPITRAELEGHALTISARFQLSVFHKIEVQIRERERQLQLLAEYAGML